MRVVLNLLILVLIANSCQSQTRKAEVTQRAGGPCEGCEAIFEYGNQKLSSRDTLPDFEKNEPKIKLMGIVFEKDGRTPASNVILYIYQTDRDGIYPAKGNETGWGKRHGYIRGWVQTGETGKYEFLTFRPSAYPGGTEPEHIHITVKESNKNEYSIDEFVFDDDPALTQKERSELENRGGSGIAKPIFKDGILTVHRDIILGLNIPNYH
jgi:protocatechuate 3,4-dioxygenase beta subunit